MGEITALVLFGLVTVGVLLVVLGPSPEEQRQEGRE